jgi:hypothetical protein
MAVLFYQAKAINKAAGGSVISPWEVGELPDSWIDMAVGMTFRLPRYQKTQKKVDDHLAAWRREHAKRSGQK